MRIQISLPLPQTAQEKNWEQEKRGYASVKQSAWKATLFSHDQKKKSPREAVSAKDLERIEPVVSSLQ